MNSKFVKRCCKCNNEIRDFKKYYKNGTGDEGNNSGEKKVIRIRKHYSVDRRHPSGIKDCVKELKPFMVNAVLIVLFIMYVEFRLFRHLCNLIKRFLSWFRSANRSTKKLVSLILVTLLCLGLTKLMTAFNNSEKKIAVEETPLSSVLP